MSDFPKMLYRFPAQSRDSSQLQDGVYDVRVVADEEAQAEAIAGGWHETAGAAKATFAAKLAADEAAAKAAAEAANNKQPTREELEAKANELALKFDGRTTDKKLGEMIAEKLKG